MRVIKDHCCGLVIDIQEKLVPHMDHSDELLVKCLTLIKGLQVLEVPVRMTEQYPKGLGQTFMPIRQLLDKVDPIDKISFSCCDEPKFSSSLEKLDKSSVIICGIEAHVCVLQTVIDLVESNYNPVVVVDCISSRSMADKHWAVERMRSEGAVITTCESILFELTRFAGSEQFKAISRLVK